MCSVSTPLAGGIWEAGRTGGPKKWEAQAVRSEARQDESRVPFSPVFFLLPPLTALNPHDAHCWRTAVTTANQRPRRQPNRWVGNPTTTTTIPPLGWSANDDDASPTEGLGTPRREEPPHRWAGAPTTTTPTKQLALGSPDEDNHPPLGGNANDD